MTVFVVRGDVVRRYPTAHVFLQKARFGQDDEIRPVADQVQAAAVRGALDRRHPLRRLRQEPGGGLRRPRGGDTGLAAGDPGAAGGAALRPRRRAVYRRIYRQAPATWGCVELGNVAAATSGLARLTHAPVDVDWLTGAPIEDTTWGHNAADMARARLQSPFRILFRGSARLAMPRAPPHASPPTPRSAVRRRPRSRSTSARRSGCSTAGCRSRSCRCVWRCASGRRAHRRRAARAHLPGRRPRGRAPARVDRHRAGARPSRLAPLLAVAPHRRSPPPRRRASAGRQDRSARGAVAWVVRAPPPSTSAGTVRAPGGRAAAAAPAFPGPAKPTTAGGPAYARPPPSRVALVIVDDTTVVGTWWGAEVADDLALAPGLVEAGDDLDGRALLDAQGLTWTYDFEEAVDGDWPSASTFDLPARSRRVLASAAAGVGVLIDRPAGRGSRRCWRRIATRRARLHRAGHADQRHRDRRTGHQPRAARRRPAARQSSARTRTAHLCHAAPGARSTCRRWSR